MATHSQLLVVINRFSAELDNIRQSLYFAEQASFSRRGPSVWPGVKSSAFVMLAANMEWATSGVLRCVVEEIDRQEIPFHKLRSSLLAIALHPQFESVKQVSFMKEMSRRVEILGTPTAIRSCQLSQGQLPLDGKTIRPHHLDLIWEIFGFAGSPLAGPVEKLALTSVADVRNELVHGDTSPVVVAGRQGIDVILRRVSQIEDIVLRLCLAADEYLQQSGFLRK